MRLARSEIAFKGEMNLIHNNIFIRLLKTFRKKLKFMAIPFNTSMSTMKRSIL
jgi:hypothetical protein